MRVRLLVQSARRASPGLLRLKKWPFGVARFSGVESGKPFIKAIDAADPGMGAGSDSKSLGVDDGTQKVVLPTPKVKGLLERFIEWKSKLVDSFSDGEVPAVKGLYNSIEAQVEHENFFRYCGFKATLPEMQQLLVLHMWIAHQRIKEDMKGKKCKFATQDFVAAFFELSWADAYIKIQDTGMNPLFINKHLKELQRSTFGTMMAYDKTFMMGALDNWDPFLGSLWRNMYGGRADVNRAHLTQMRDYVVKQVEHVRNMPQEHFYNKEGTALPLLAPPNKLPVSTKEASSLDPEFARSSLYGGEKIRTF